MSKVKNDKRVSCTWHTICYAEWAWMLNEISVTVKGHFMGKPKEK